MSIKVELLSEDTGSVVAKFKGSAVKIFLEEAGQHCIQRVPPTERNGRRQTSYVMVAVLPLPPANEIKLLPESELTITTMRGTGPGGQHRNNTESCVRAVHTATGLSAVVDGRDQRSNKREAIKILSVRVATLLNSKTQGDYDAMRREQMGDGSRGSKIRTYNFADKRAVDHRTNKKTKAVDLVIGKGKFELLR